MKTAVLLVGNIRTWEQCKDSFIQTFGAGVDVFVTTYNKRYAYHPYIQGQLNFYDDQILNREEIQVLFKEVNLAEIHIDDIDSYVDTSVKPFICDKFPKESYLSLSQYFKLNDGINMILEHEKAKGFKYDCIIKSRFDVTYNKFNIPVLDNVVYVDRYGAGVFPCDWIFITTRNSAVSMNESIMSEIKDMKHESSLQDMPHKLFLNGIKDSSNELRTEHMISALVRGR